MPRLGAMVRGARHLGGIRLNAVAISSAALTLRILQGIGQGRRHRDAGIAGAMSGLSRQDIISAAGYVRKVPGRDMTLAPSRTPAKSVD
jgi:hypothetical protein